MKQLISILILTMLIFCSCRQKNTKEYFDEDFVVVDYLCSINYDTFFASGYDVKKVFKNGYRRLVNIRDKSTSLIKNIDENNIVLDSIYDFCDLTSNSINIYLDTDITLSKKQIRNLIGNKSLLKFKIKYLEYISTSIIINRLIFQHQDINLLRIKVVPQKKIIKLGEDYEASIYMTAFNQYKPFVAILEGDTIPNINGVPTLKIKTKSRGYKTSKGYLYYNCWDSIYKIPFNIEYEVK